MTAMFVHAAPADLSSHHEAAKPDPALAIRQAQQSHQPLATPVGNGQEGAQRGDGDH